MLIPVDSLPYHLQVSVSVFVCAHSRYLDCGVNFTDGYRFGFLGNSYTTITDVMCVRFSFFFSFAVSIARYSE